MNTILIYLVTCFSFCFNGSEYKNDFEKYEKLVRNLELCFYPDNFNEEVISAKQVLRLASPPSICRDFEEGKKIIAEGKPIVPFLLKYKKTSYHIRGCIAFLIMEIYGWTFRDFTPFYDYNDLLNKIEEKIKNEFSSP